MNRHNVMHMSQLFRLMVLFELGSALVFPLNIQAKEAAWISTLMGMSAGLIIYTVFCYILQTNPQLPFTVVLESVVGKVLGKILAFLYMLFFIYQAGRQFNHFALLMSISIFDQTPQIILHAMLLLAIGYVLSLGVMAFARTGEVFYIVMLFMIVLASLLILFSGAIDISRLMPVLGDGVSSILKSFPHSVHFPFTEIIGFMMLTPFLKESGLLLRTGLTSLIVSGVILAWITALNLSVVGVDIVSNSFFPFLMSIGEVNISHFIQRLDAIAVMMLITGMAFKAGVFYLASVVAAMRLFNIPSYRQGLLIIGMVIFLSTLVISPNSSHHMQEGFVTNHWLIYIPFEIVIPVLVAVWIWTRKKWNNSRS